MGTVLKAVVSPLASIVGGVFSKPKPPKAPLQAPPRAERSSLVSDELARRQGTRANRRSSGRQEASGGKKSKLGG